MINALDEIIYYPATRKTMTEELRSAIGLYQSHQMTNDQFYFLIDHYATNFAYLFFSDDYNVHPTIRNQLGIRNVKVIESVLREIQKSAAEKDSY